MNSLAIWVGAIVILFVVGLITALTLEFHRKFPGFGAGLVVASILLAITGPLVYEFPSPAFSVVRQHSDGTLELCPNGTWEFGYEVFNVPNLASASSHERVVTENPKVRDLAYYVALECVDPVAFLKADEQRRDPPGSNSRGEAQTATSARVAQMREIAEFHCFEFNNAYSRRIAEFYNPLDQQQQEKFSKLVCDWLNERLAKDGLAAKIASFQIK